MLLSNCPSSEPDAEAPILVEENLGAIAAYVAERASGKGLGQNMSCAVPV